MGDNTALGDRMKRYEAVTKAFLPRRTYTIIRVDGKAFHSYLRHAEKPFDKTFMKVMDETAAALCAEVSGTVFAFTQSDEVSLLVQDFSSVHTEPWFGGNVQKVVSVAASAATAAFGNRVEFYKARGFSVGTGLAMFDARVFTIPDPVEVANYFLWRQRDAVRNSVSMAAQAHFSHRELQGVDVFQMQEKLWAERGVNWNDYPVRARRGGVCVRVTSQEEITFLNKRTMEEETITPVRSRWETQDALRLTAEADGFLAGIIPVMPSLGE